MSNPFGGPSRPTPRPAAAATPPRRPRALITTAIILVVGFMLLSGFASFWTERLWFDSVGYTGVFTTLLLTKLGLFLVFASLMAKDAHGMLTPFAPLRPRIVAVPIEGHDCRAPADLALLAKSFGLQAQAAPNLFQALTTVTAPARVLIFGSLYLAGEALTANGEQPS